MFASGRGYDKESKMTTEEFIHEQEMTDAYVIALDRVHTRILNYSDVYEIEETLP